MGRILVVTLLLALAPTLGAEDFLFAGNLAGYGIDPATGTLTPLPGSPYPPVPGGYLTGAALDPFGRYLYVTRDDVFSPPAPARLYGYSVDAATGALVAVPGSPFTTPPRPNSVVVHPSGRFLYSKIQGGILARAIDPATGSLTDLPGLMDTSCGAPFRLAITPSGAFLYSLSFSFGGCIISIDESTGALTLLPGSVPRGAQGGVVDPSGRFLYVGTNAGILGYAIDPSSGALTPILGSPFNDGEEKWGLAIDPAGRFLFAANNSGAVSAFSRDAGTGALTVVSGSPFPGQFNGGRDVVVDRTGRFVFVSGIVGAPIAGYAINTSSGALAPVPGSPFSPGGIVITTGRNFTRGDFDSNGLTDILWRHDLSGENVVWHMNGSTVAGGTFTDPAALPDLNWRMVGTHDFNGDRESDILWRHEISGENVVWYMTGHTLAGGTFLTPSALADPNWKIAGTGDFNGDGRPDVVWYHQVSGEVAIWYMNGATLVGGTFTNPSAVPPATGWRVVGVADFNNDGRPDVLWRNALGGEVMVWFMADHVGTSATLTNPPAEPDQDWRIVALGDYNPDRKTDIVWRHAVSGANAIWLMDGVNRIGGAVQTTALDDANWKIVGPR